MKLDWDRVIEGALTLALGGAGTGLGILWRSKMSRQAYHDAHKELEDRMQALDERYRRIIQATRDAIERNAESANKALGLLDARIAAVQSEARENDEKVTEQVHRLHQAAEELEKERLEALSAKMDLRFSNQDSTLEDIRRDQRIMLRRIIGVEGDGK